MENTHEFVDKLHETQAKDEKNRAKGKGHPSDRLPNKQHSQRNHKGN